MANAVYMFYKMVPEDIIYDTLPLYHTAGGILGIYFIKVHYTTEMIWTMWYFRHRQLSHKWMHCCHAKEILRFEVLDRLHKTRLYG